MVTLIAIPIRLFCIGESLDIIRSFRSMNGVSLYDMFYMRPKQKSQSKLGLGFDTALTDGADVLTLADQRQLATTKLVHDVDGDCNQRQSNRVGYDSGDQSQHDIEQNYEDYNNCDDGQNGRHESSFRIVAGVIIQRVFWAKSKKI